MLYSCIQDCLQHAFKQSCRHAFCLQAFIIGNAEISCSHDVQVLQPSVCRVSISEPSHAGLLAPILKHDVFAAFVSAPNLTAAAAAQNLSWAPVSVTSVEVVEDTVAMSSATTAVVTLYLTAELGVSGSIQAVAPDAVDSSSERRRRSLLDGSSGNGL